MTSSDDISARWWVGGNPLRFVTVFGTGGDVWLDFQTVRASLAYLV